MKNVFRSIKLGVSSFYREVRPLLIVLATGFASIIPTALIGIAWKKSSDYEGIKLLVFIISLILSYALLFLHKHYKDAKKYAEKNLTSIEEAWERTRSDDGEI